VKSQLRYRLRLLCSVACLCACWAAGPQALAAPRHSRLGRHIENILRRSEAGRGFWGIVIARLPDGKVLYERNADHLFQPASNMKLFTTAAALAKLGPDYVFRTTVESDALPDARGRVDNLILVGRGDPNISGRVIPYQYDSKPVSPADAVLRDLAEQVMARGVREVTGDIVADDRYFIYEPFGHDWSAEDLQWGYGAPVTALAFNDNSLTIHFQPGAKQGDTAVVSLAPVADYYRLNNRLGTSAPGTDLEIFVERLPWSMTLDVWGEIPAGAPEDTDTVAITDPPRLAAGLFEQALEARGVAARGQVKVLETSRIQAANMVDPFAAPGPRVVLAEHKSVPLRQEIQVINKVSQNLHAEMLLRTLGREVKNYGSLTVGLQVLNDFAAEVGIDPRATYFADGSGLSREALVTPRAIVELLVYMANSPNGGVYFDSLPIAGVDGTLANRFEGSSAIGKIHAKTGTIEHVNTLSGYMELPSGRRLAFSLLADNNDLKSGHTIKTLDAIAQTIYDAYGGKKRRPRATRRKK
jgi:D-alanyl-D-alanine carboxypeptidase/D-alanyl-D-alanine-endopeptidase (penicillin-binding protein 4)